MGIFSSILNKIFHHAGVTPANAQPASPSATPATNAAPAGSPAPAAPGGPTPGTGTNAAPAAAPMGQADVEKVLTEIAAKKGGGGNWKVSIVDLLKMLDLDSSLTARKELAEELNVHAGEHGSAEQNIALSKAVWQQLAQNGGKVPESLRS